MSSQFALRVADAGKIVATYVFFGELLGDVGSKEEGQRAVRAAVELNKGSAPWSEPEDKGQQKAMHQV